VRAPDYERGGVRLWQGDCLALLPELEAGSVDAVVCDPPYGLGFMGKDWDHGIPGVAFWTAALRVAKPGAHLLAFGGTRTFHRLACAIEDAGWEIRDCLMWVYGSGFPKSLDVSKAIGDGGTAWHGWGTALKPAWEPIILARKPLAGTVAANVLRYGTGGLNIDGCRIEAGENDYDHPGIQEAGCGKVICYGEFDNKYKQSAPNAIGRFPANLIHDGSDEVVRLFPDCSSGGFPNDGGMRTHNGIYGTPSVRKDGDIGPNNGSAARFFYCAKASKQDRDEGLHARAYRTAGECTDRRDGTAGLNSPRAGAGRTSGARNHHPTVKPTDLMRYLCRLVTPPGGIVLDPFMGSGSTGKAAVKEGFRFAGIEIDADYLDIAAGRIRAAQEDTALLDESGATGEQLAL
jgi:DNA modification methylase